jgi:hypothetical protein
MLAIIATFVKIQIMSYRVKMFFALRNDWCI